MAKGSNGGMSAGKIIGVVLGLMTVVGTVIAVLTFIQGLEPSFGSSIDIDQPGNADSLIQFLRANDSKKVHLDFVCLASGTGACDADSTPVQAQAQAEGNAVLGVRSGGTIYWLHILTVNSNAQADNGGYGAGALVVKGHFEIAIVGAEGTTPPDIQNINLRGQ